MCIQNPDGKFSGGARLSLWGRGPDRECRREATNSHDDDDQPDLRAAAQDTLARGEYAIECRSSSKRARKQP